MDFWCHLSDPSLNNPSPFPSCPASLRSDSPILAAMSGYKMSAGAGRFSFAAVYSVAAALSVSL